MFHERGVILLELLKEKIMIKLGDKVKDTVTGHSGIVVARSEWLYGCVRLAVQGRVKDGKVPDALWTDEPQVIKMKGGVKVKKTKRLKGPVGRIPGTGPITRRAL